MVTNPIIVDSTGYVGNGTDIWMMCLYTNDTEGLAKIIGSRYDINGNICYIDEFNSRIPCFYKTENNLKNKVKVIVNHGILFNYGCIEIFPCTLDFNCGQTCTVIGSRTQFVWGTPIHAIDTTIPPSPTGLLITPGNRQLNIQWNKVPGSNIFAYYISIFFGGNLWTSGYTLESQRNVIISGLTNGATYDIEVSSLTYNDYSSSATIGSGTPEQPCNLLTTDMIIY